MDLMYTLAQADNIELFQKKSVQILIDHQYSHWQKRSNWMFGFPLIAQLVIFWFWSNIVIVGEKFELEEEALLGDDASKIWYIPNTICIILMNVLSLYFLVNEIPQAIKMGRKYITVQHFINWLIAFGLAWNSFNKDVLSESFWTVQTWLALMLWLRFGLYLSTVPTFSWLVRMCIACVVDMLTFLVILFIGVFAFADAFLSIDQVLIIKGDIEAPEIQGDRFYYKYIQ